MVNLPYLLGSCPNFLRPTYPYTECRLSSLTGSCPTVITFTGYSSCLLIVTVPPPRSSMVLTLSVDALPSFALADFYSDEDSSSLVTSFLFQNPARLPYLYGCPAGSWIFRILRQVLCRRYLMWFSFSDILHHFFRIIPDSFF